MYDGETFVDFLSRKLKINLQAKKNYFSYFFFD